MKSIYIAGLIFILALGVASAQNPGEGYQINGTVRGERAEGKWVYLVDKPFNTESWKRSDSTIIKGGKFQFKGSLKSPTLYYIFIENDNPNPKGKRNDVEGRLSHLFYLENSAISYSAHYDSLPTFFGNEDKRRVVTVPAVIEGSRSDVVNNQLKSVLKPIKGSKKRAQATYEFIVKQPGSVISIQEATLLLQGLELFTMKELDLLEEKIGKEWSGTELMKPFEEALAKARRIAIAQPYTDFEVYDIKGAKKKISSYIPSKYTILEFWASWCGPCRAKIPHLKEVAKRYGDKVEIISIAIEERNDGTWKRAMAAEKMPWKQFLVKGHNVSKSFVGQVYPLYAIPWSLLIDPQGKIVGGNMSKSEFDDFFAKTIK